MYKLYDLGITGKLWSLINQCHQNTVSSIVVNQTQSEWFPVNQGVRQAGVLSTCLYLVYIEDLIHDRQAGSPNTGILHIPSSCLSLADELLLIGLSPLALQSLLNITTQENGALSSMRLSPVFYHSVHEEQAQMRCHGI